MGCFLDCFSSSEDRKRRKRRYKAIRRDQTPKSQNIVQADVSLVQSIKDKPCESLPESRGKSEEPLSLNIKKKVTFDTNVTTYEHVEIYDSTESLLEKNEKGETFPKSGHTHSHFDFRDGSDIPNGGSYPPNYRYGNCLESDDEVEESDYEDDENDSGLDDEEDYDDEDGITSQEVWRESIPLPVPSSESGIESSLSPVLKPVENLAQWKALKSKGTVAPPPKPLDSNPQKENFSFNFNPFNWNQETAVDASLNWLVSAEKNSPNNQRAGCYNPDLEPTSSGKSFSQESAITSVQSIEDRPILGALTVDELKQFSGSSYTPRKSPGRSPDDMPIIGSVGSYWSHTGSAQSLSSTSSYKGIPNATSKYREFRRFGLKQATGQDTFKLKDVLMDKKVNWQNTPFETRLERALNGDAAEC